MHRTAAATALLHHTTAPLRRTAAAADCCSPSSQAVLSYPFVAGSAMGLARLDSHSGYRRVLEDALRFVGPQDIVAFKFGQVGLRRARE